MSSEAANFALQTVFNGSFSVRIQYEHLGSGEVRVIVSVDSVIVRGHERYRTIHCCVDHSDQ